MHLFFGDDSVRKGVREGMGMLVAFGGVLIEDDALRPFQLKVAEIRKKYGVPANEEFKWSPNRRSWIYRNLHGERRQDCYRSILVGAREVHATAFVVCFDRGRRPDVEQVALRKCIDWCFERVTMCLQDRGQLGLLVFDRPGGGRSDEDTLLASVLATIEQGTEFVSPTQVPLNILTTSSHLVAELQLADLVTGITTAMIAGDTGYAAPLFEEIIPLFHRNAVGLVGGAGLKLYPNELLNLHYWVGGERSFARVAVNDGWSLPYHSWPYSLDDGLLTADDTKDSSTLR
jgi:hypothetical protein